MPHLLKLEFKGGTDVLNPKRAWIVLGNHGCLDNGWPILGAECVSANEVKEWAEKFKQELDLVVKEAEKKFKK